MRIYLCEKPSGARSLKEALGGGRYVKPSQSFIVGHIEGNGWIITWLSGHFYRLSEPYEHDERFRTWRLADLPMVIEDHYWKPIDYDTGRLTAAEINEQIEHIKSLYPRATEMCIASDAGQEGQLLAQNFVQETNWKGPVTRLWTGSWNPDDLKKAIAEIKPNSHYQGYYEAASARTIADAWIGFNFTRLFRLLAQQAGYNAPGSVGRVRSSALALVVDSDLKHEQHRATGYYDAQARFSFKDEEFNAKLVMPKGLLNDQERCTNLQGLESYLSQLSSVVNLPVLDKNVSAESKAPPLPLCHNTACQFMAKHYDMMPEETDKCLQSLYDKGLMSYPRTEEEVYETGDLDTIVEVANMLSDFDPRLKAAINDADMSRKPSTFNSAEVEEHSALIVKPKRPDSNALSKQEMDTYFVIATHMIAQFADPLVTANTNILIGNDSHTFAMSGTTTESRGWSAFLPHETKQDSLPNLCKGDLLDLLDVEIQEKKTKAPARMTVVAFLAALKDCTRFLSPAVREKIGKGQLGTAATQSSYKQTLERAKDVTVQSGKFIVSTKQGRQLKSLTPPILNNPDMTSLWELQFRAIRKGETTKEAFLENLKQWLTATVIESKEKRFKPSPIMQPCPRCGCALVRKKSKQGQSFFYVCSGDDCEEIIDDLDGRPVTPLSGHGSPCTNCKAPMKTRVRKKVLPKPGQKVTQKDRRYLACSSRCKLKTSTVHETTKEQ